MIVELPELKELFRMAKENPIELETLRLLLIEKVIKRSDENQQKRLTSLQFKIDSIIKKSNNPLQSTVLISKLMNDSVNDLNFVFKNGHIKKFENSIVIPFNKKTT